ncbi:MAG TPA: UDP-3-O-(3-hydroxymyristoyl)glucosamine N-acyltransferase [Bacteroidales bacterium]|jgi:UDP-3-O-[3-hydroxymyristoyl] glucosamine N-acyltransferase|nr:UDP-3-O-(3-hydroxymyristoyl)glucosamine N-acyltransferase [Bacteroidales bacterium]MCZ2418162.1 UDP-3-O-(3-hydroxymyristoyl)glucosamine N-acyltransferase [Burkholderiales bacterium]OQC57544.1 MAG: UDP-3-O-acylglucosamine N-acyltransferase [Bacteroidetes bacterium ADurb.Bin013]MBP8999723.1 UDP-3-O-(3-hydroxymyristoyl)glucosamine N-acyltransferase [Bacteroidales bacterium]MBV6456112.1 UDP-3-O-acylglucosamine N-acyltransferase [Bacteroidales bacterium]
MELTAGIIAKHLKGEVAGDPDVVVTAMARIEQGKKGTACFLANPKYEKYLYQTKASIVLINRDFTPTGDVSATLVKVDNAYAAAAELLGLFSSEKKKSGWEFPHFISRRTSIGRKVYIGAHSYIGKRVRIGNGAQIYPQVYLGENVRIGAGTILYPGVKVYDDCIIGERCIIHANAVIGSDGFGFSPMADGTYRKIPQTGNVIIEDDVEIGANTVIDRATMGSTIIRRGVKLDNLIQIAHNVEVGENTVMAAQSGIAGSTRLGANCMIAGQAGIVGHLTIADGTQVGAQAGIIGSVKEKGSALLGMPAIDHSQFMRAYALFRKSGKKDK